MTEDSTRKRRRRRRGAGRDIDGGDTGTQRAAQRGSSSAPEAAKTPTNRRPNASAPSGAPRSAATATAAAPAERDAPRLGRAAGRSERQSGAEPRSSRVSIAGVGLGAVALTPRTPMTTLPPNPDAEEDDQESERGESWGTDDDSPAPAISLASAWPTDGLAVDPSTDGLRLQVRLDANTVNSVAVRFVHAGRLVWFDAGNTHYDIGSRVIVDSERGQRLATVAVAAAPREQREPLRPVLRLATANDVASDGREQARLLALLAKAKDAANATSLPVKVFRVEVHADKHVVYYTTDEQRLDARQLVAKLSSILGGRVDVRGVGSRDEAKLVGGIGSCGQELCCSTWLPEFVPVSIKMAKDQGMVLTPTKVAGQCGRLKCCLVYEQSMYAELRKGLPKLGKRVVTERGEGRVTEVDVLRQRIRVSYGPGDMEVHAATDVRPLFPSGNAKAVDHDPTDDDADELTNLPPS